MKRQSPMLRAIAGGVIAVAALASAARARAQYAVFDADAALQVFHERVESYAALHRRLAPPAATVTGTDPLLKLLTRQYLASAVRSPPLLATGRNLLAGNRHVVPVDAGGLDW